MTSSKLASVLGAVLLLGHAASLPGNPAAQAPAVAPAVTSLSSTSADRSGYLEINGTNFGTSDGTALIGGVAAPIGTWSDTRIVTWVPEATALGASSVQVVNLSGEGSNSVALTVTARQANGKAKWRFRQNGPYSQVRPALGADGTIYSVDVYQHLYALTPEGALKWVARNAGANGVSVGSDGTIYTGNESAIKAFNPDGSLKWSFPINPIGLYLYGPNVGPDGNIYCVATEGPGTFSLTPAGTLRWAVAERFTFPVVFRSEIVFGPGPSKTQLYFSANNHTRAYDVDGKLVWTLTGSAPQLAVGPEGNVHVPYGAYLPADGRLAWVFSSPYPYNVSDAPDVGSNGIHYTVQNTIELFALSTTGSQIWHFTQNGIFGAPVVDPQNTQLVQGSKQTLDKAGYITSSSAQDGHELWRFTLPPENGFNQASDSRARFTPDGLSAYMMTFTATGNNDTSASFLYALDTTATATLPPLKSTKITLTAKTSGTSVKGTSKVTVQDGAGALVVGATVAVTWNLPSGATTSQSAVTSSKGVASFSVTDIAGTYTITVTDVSKAGYTFDAANSVLTKSARSR